jgi:hypothetical protein
MAAPAKWKYAVRLASLSDFGEDRWLREDWSLHAPSDTETQMNEFGVDGYELVSCIQSDERTLVLIFKRPD